MLGPDVRNEGLTATAAAASAAQLNHNDTVLGELDREITSQVSSLKAAAAAAEQKAQELIQEIEEERAELISATNGLTIQTLGTMLRSRLAQLQDILNQQHALAEELAQKTRDLALRYRDLATIPLSKVSYHPNTPNPPLPITKAAMDSDINQALDDMGITGAAAREKWTAGLQHAATNESSWEPWAVNTWDSNAVGPPAPDTFPAGSSRGLLQMTPGNFATYHASHTSNNIYNPVANIAASINYLMDDPVHHYYVDPDASNLFEVQQFNPSEKPHGY